MEIKLKDEFIKLGQALKAAGLVDSGVVAKIVIQDGEVLVNGEVETRRGKNYMAVKLCLLMDRKFAL
jgi:YaaA_near_RecF: S4 domain protein YaaA